MKLLEIEVKGLFGTFNHIIPLAFSDRVTIIHGPNGYGKTMMLKMISSLIVGRLSIFASVPFEEFIARLDNGSTIYVRPPEPLSKKKDAIRKASIIVKDQQGNELSAVEVAKPELPRHVLDGIDRFIPSPFSRTGGGWVNTNTSELYSVDQILDRFPSVITHLPEKYRTIPIPLFEGLEVFFVETKRLDAEISTRSMDTRLHQELDFFEDEDAPVQSKSLRVEQYSKDIVQRIKAALGNYARSSQERDRTFPERLVRFIRDGNRPLPEKEIVRLMEELETKRQRLISFGFLDSEVGLHGLTEDDVRRAAEALTIYVDDVKLKLAVFDDLADRVGRLMDIVNDRFKYKTLTLQREYGFRLRSTAGEPVKIEELSSGEQHELVVLYELLFRAPKNGLVLVDEPEISLHVAWQSRFLKDLMGILALTDSYGIVATHSPVIIGTRWDITKELSGPELVDDGGIDAR
ncbi:AAA family ATPase [Duganella sp. BJB1802]|uniref:AAA family ATPase n=1 Tax=Duganella sp. BJB1802 TaxID=2744575 RepID=UPI001592C544|nr:AAA family ATPase [Duganella sp. BJB1802]NVD71169.1 AAA family ATPase [Duganella sp. BJB1802]